MVSSSSMDGGTGQGLGQGQPLPVDPNTLADQMQNLTMGYMSQDQKQEAFIKKCREAELKSKVLLHNNLIIKRAVKCNSQVLNFCEDILAIMFDQAGDIDTLNEIIKEVAPMIKSVSSLVSRHAVKTHINYYYYVY